MQEKYKLNLFLCLCVVIIILASIEMGDYLFLIPALLIYVGQIVEGCYAKTMKTVLQVRTLD